jgi:adenylate kinase
MKIVLLGPPGAGKGTLASLLKDKFDLVHISTGDILREEMKSGSDLGREAKRFVESGGLVPDDVVTRLIENKLTHDKKVEQGFLLDGFPRTTRQAEDLDRILERLDKKLDYAILMEAGLLVIIQRLTGRRVCRQCGAVYHIKNMPPKKAGKCDLCGGELYQRTDDKEETIKTRIAVYSEKTAPIIDYYARQGKLRKINAEKDTQVLLRDLTAIINERDSASYQDQKSSGD